ncbi:hypothetical protein [Ulvibacter litoralis]|uniref:YhhN-like protein n=1 Tax=Ulvibacter litoralis TaxID=227084 RepID=A0A1G7D1D3_9FLAO|nr:hypothetical protein [Ulvibacter litoralis]SDE45504.1 hypothetical protein SAMN05421855_101714 [Ulvibacter litoralis]
MKISKLAESLTYASPVILLIGICIGVYYYKYLQYIYRVLFFFLAVNLGIDLLSRYLASMSHNNLFLFIVISLVELVTFSFIYYHIIEKKKIIVLLTVIGLGYVLTETLSTNFQNIFNFQSYSKVVSSFLVVLMVLIYFIEVLYREYKISIPLINLNLLIMAYFTLELILLLPLNFLINGNQESIYYIWLLRTLILLIFYIIMIHFLWNHGKNQKQLRCG